VFEGDHCGPEVIVESVKVLKVLEKKRGVKFNLDYQLLGGCSINAHGTALTADALARAKAANAVLLGAVGGPEWGTGAVRPEQGLLLLRKELGTFGNLRPCNFAAESLVQFSPLKESVCRDVDFCIVRELTGGIYFGDRKEATPESPDDAWDVEPYSRAEIQRITRLAGMLCMQHEPPLPLWSLDKANVLATSRLWRKTVQQTVESEFPRVKLHHQLIDSAAMLMVKSPRSLNGVIVTSNLFGDIISDEASVIPGSLGLLPSASLAGIPDGKTGVNGIYEPIHGSAPDIAGKGIVNPVATVLSVAMMLRYSCNLEAEAQIVEKAVRQVLDSGVRTGDLEGTASTKQVGDEIARVLETLL